MLKLGRCNTLLNPTKIHDYTSAGAWKNKTIADYLDELSNSDPDLKLISDKDYSLTVRKLSEFSTNLSSNLTKMGMEPGDVLSFQLPNWWETAVIDMAAARLGLIVNPIVPIYRRAELQFILQDSKSKLYFGAGQYRDRNIFSEVRDLSNALPDLLQIVPVRSSDENELDFMKLVGSGANTPNVKNTVDPNFVKLLMYTSGTSGRPKGVLHTHNTLNAEIQSVIHYWQLNNKDRVLMPAPVTHIGGYLYGLQLSVTLGVETVFLDEWDAETAAELIEEYGVTMTVGATPFLQELVEFAANRNLNLPSLRFFGCGGAPVPPELIYRTHKVFSNCCASRIYGSTEAPTVTLGVIRRDQEDLAANTEGFVVGHQVKLVDGNSEEVEIGVEGEIFTRSAENFVGYSNSEDNQSAFDEYGYFKTGDLAIESPKGCLTITGRKKDLIIRGGENISPKEIEDLLHQHPLIQEVAIVAMPHSRLGETSCAFAKVCDGSELYLTDVLEFLDNFNLAKQKYPERLELIEIFPRTPSGKIRKNILREIVAKKLVSGSSG